MISLDDHEGQSAIANMHIDHSQVKYDAYQKHQVFELIDHMMDYYEGISDTSFSFIPNGTLTFGNYATYVYMSIRSTLDSIKMLLKAGHITDAFVLIRKLFDTVLVEIYLNVVREDQFDWMKCIVVKDVDEWLRKGHWIPKTEKILSVLKESKSTKDLYPMFGWDTYLKKNRSLLDNHVHASSYRSILLNCQDIHIDNREKELKNASIILNQIMLLHLSFNFYLNGPYMIASDYMDYWDMNMEPPEGSESWIALYAQEAFDEFIKPHPRLAEFIREHCCLDIA